MVHVTLSQSAPWENLSIYKTGIFPFIIFLSSLHSRTLEDFKGATSCWDFKSQGEAQLIKIRQKCFPPALTPLQTSEVSKPLNRYCLMNCEGWGMGRLGSGMTLPHNSPPNLNSHKSILGCLGLELASYHSFLHFSFFFLSYWTLLMMLNP